MSCSVQHKRSPSPFHSITNTWPLWGYPGLVPPKSGRAVPKSGLHGLQIFQPVNHEICKPHLFDTSLLSVWHVFTSDLREQKKTLSCYAFFVPPVVCSTAQLLLKYLHDPDGIARPRGIVLAHITHPPLLRLLSA